MPLARALLARGETVLGIDNFSDYYAPVLKFARLKPLRDDKAFTGDVVSGLSNRGIAAKLVIGDETVKSHLRSIYRKLGVSDRTGAGGSFIR